MEPEHMYLMTSFEHQGDATAVNTNVTGQSCQSLPEAIAQSEEKLVVQLYAAPLTDKLTLKRTC